jgi:hypothetical protein
MPPKWNAAEPYESFMAYAEFLQEQARGMFLASGTHLEILFLLSSQGVIQPQPIAPPMGREQIADILRQQLPDSDVYGLIHIAEAWAYFHEGLNDPTLKQIVMGEIKPSELRDEHRSEVLLISLLTRDGQRQAWYDEIRRDQEGRCSFGRSGRNGNAKFPLGNVFEE